MCLCSGPWQIFHFALGNGKEAEKYYKLALSLGLEPEKRAQLLQDYAKCMAASNANERALELYSELENLPGHAISGLIRKSQIERHLPDSDIAQQLHKMLNDQCLEKEQRSDILLSLGNMYDNAGRHDEAFEYWSKSRALKTIAAKETIGIETVEKIKKFYSASLLQQAAKYGHTSERPVFVVGMPRSGTTLTEQIISSHPEAYGVGELGRMQKLVPSFTKDYTVTNYIEKLIQNAKAGELKARANETLNLLEILAGSAPRFVVDKLPTQYLAMGYIHLCFPNAKYIHCQRHPADSFISSFQNNMKQFHEYSFDQLLYAETYLAKQNLMAHWKSIFPERIFDLKYEKLVTKPEETVREMLDFIGLPWDSACMSFFERDRTVKTFSRDQVRNPIYTSSVYRWKKYEKNLEPLFADLKAADFEYSDV